MSAIPLDSDAGLRAKDRFGPHPCAMQGDARRDAQFELPSGATFNADGSVTLRLSQPIEGRLGVSIGELVFRRLSGAVRREVERERSLLDAGLTKMLGPVAARAFRAHGCEADAVAAFNVVGMLLGKSKHIPERVKATPAGGYELPLLHPVADGGSVHRALHFRPISRQALALLSQRSKDKWLTAVMQQSSGLSARSVRNLADRMDAVDYAATQAIMEAIAANAVRGRAAPEKGA